MKDLSPKELARALGASESSVKRWVDDGALAAARTAGGHRRIAMGEAVRFVRERGIPVVNPEVIVGAFSMPETTHQGAASADATAEQFYELLCADDAAAARAMVRALYVAGWSVSAICDGPIRYALEKIGILWQHGPDGIVIEHRATDTCVRALAELRSLFAMPALTAVIAVGAAPSGDPYILPSMMAAAVLADLGFRDHNLGPDCPMDALTNAVHRYQPRLVWLAMRMKSVNERMPKACVELAQLLATQQGILVVGGNGAPVLPTTTGLVQINSMAELAALAQGLQSARIRLDS